jgi:hypothetical protein
MEKRRSRRARRKGEEGASALELMMTISLIFFLMIAVIQISLISCTKLITNYSAWIAARVWAVNEDNAEGKARQAGKAVLEILRWGPIEDGFIGIQPANEGVLVEYETSLGMPFLLKNSPTGRIKTVGWGAVPRDPNGFEERGDNRER